jgi:hypothetical protein
MFELTVHTRATVSISAYPGFDDAYRALMRYIVDADYYLAEVDTDPQQRRYALIDIGDAQRPRTPTRVPRQAGYAVITDVAGDRTATPDPAGIRSTPHRG